MRKTIESIEKKVAPFKRGMIGPDAFKEKELATKLRGVDAYLRETTPKPLFSDYIQQMLIDMQPEKDSDLVFERNFFSVREYLNKTILSMETIADDVCALMTMKYKNLASVIQYSGGKLVSNSSDADPSHGYIQAYDPRNGEEIYSSMPMDIPEMYKDIKAYNNYIEKDPLRLIQKTKYFDLIF